MRENKKLIIVGIGETATIAYEYFLLCMKLRDFPFLDNI